MGVFPPGSDPDEEKWPCHASDVFLAVEIFADVGIGGEETYKKGVVVNWGCVNVGFRDF